MESAFSREGALIKSNLRNFTMLVMVSGGAPSGNTLLVMTCLRQLCQRSNPHPRTRRQGHGCDPADVKVQVENDNVLVISGEREAPNTRGWRGRVWTVTVKKLPPPEPKKPKTIEVKFA
ncbi:hypothetical protein CK203_072133 [Vitis vinifera]|uniref:SHSP domain-containing protein n=1 Tax=Vitis vinifera TaxID=29760 RepID=A0A438EXH1_VITVI|nr:hypothetical protein CK203_072133 [Vitis vinifera]